ncbi:hypothetical protein EIN_180020 [Entamoeba invadens IP1]|uniref:hypothetical protein n=1 Tax=Entamoeba invadens IP1 TaxID=370355 RepID=UPI0002C3DBC5|nr:hypothetical protein EIN_180020 [Entamoeba invadens IP1]ELP93945.1 hypothetical protein EIN_180020 [Entamoeba invadens IP1]|eukprot:XP_004260716.1 hypothetical protein EIN_180020 [Entamoeba invadens IP1]
MKVIKNIFTRTKYFGTSLETLQNRKTGQFDHRIPSLIYFCCVYLSEPRNAIKPGLFRIPPNQSVLDKLQRDINSDGVTHIKHFLFKSFDKDVYLCSGLLNSLLYELPFPLIPRESVIYMQDLLQQPQSAQRLFDSLPQTHQDILAFLSIFFYYLANFSELNKMNERSFGIVETPVFVRINKEDAFTFPVTIVQNGLTALFKNAPNLVPKHLFEIFKIPFVPLAIDSNKMLSQNIQPVTFPITVEINTIEDISTYLEHDRLFFHRPAYPQPMSYFQLLQEYQALKTGIALYTYNYFNANNAWPSSPTLTKLNETLAEMKAQVAKEECNVQADSSRMYFTKYSPNAVPQLPTTVTGLGGLMSDLKNETDMLTARLTVLPSEDTFLLRNDVHGFAERRVIEIKLYHAQKLSQYIQNNLNEILDHTIDDSGLP